MGILHEMTNNENRRFQTNWAQESQVEEDRVNHIILHTKNTTTTNTH